LSALVISLEEEVVSKSVFSSTKWNRTSAFSTLFHLRADNENGSLSSFRGSSRSLVMQPCMDMACRGPNDSLPAKLQLSSWC